MQIFFGHVQTGKEMLISSFYKRNKILNTHFYQWTTEAKCVAPKKEASK